MKLKPQILSTEVLNSEGARAEGSAKFPSHTSLDALVARPNLAECYFTVQRLHCTKVWWERQPLSSCHDGRSSTWSDGGVEQRFLMRLPSCSLNSLSCLSKIGTHFPRSVGKSLCPVVVLYDVILTNVVVVPIRWWIFSDGALRREVRHSSGEVAVTRDTHFCSLHGHTVSVELTVFKLRAVCENWKSFTWRNNSQQAYLILPQKLLIIRMCSAATKATC